MNELCQKYPEQLAVLAFPSNQFAHQENCDGEEILHALEHVRPGGGFVSKATIFKKVIVNGSEEDPIFTFLKSSLSSCSDPKGEVLGNPKFINWSPVKRSDIAWNFEKFLLHPDGTPVKRYSRHFLISDMEQDIKQLLPHTFHTTSDTMTQNFTSQKIMKAAEINASGAEATSEVT